MKFEYKMLERVYPVSESELDALGSLGWELVGMVSHEYSKRVDISISTKISRLIYTFKREIEMNNLDYSKVFEVLVKETANYVKCSNGSC